MQNSWRKMSERTVMGCGAQLKIEPFQFWANFEPILNQFWTNFEPILNQFWTNFVGLSWQFRCVFRCVAGWFGGSCSRWEEMMNFVLITRSCVSKTRKFAFTMMIFAGTALASIRAMVAACALRRDFRSIFTVLWLFYDCFAADLGLFWVYFDKQEGVCVCDTQFNGAACMDCAADVWKLWLLF